MRKANSACLRLVMSLARAIAWPWDAGGVQRGQAQQAVEDLAVQAAPAHLHLGLYPQGQDLLQGGFRQAQLLVIIEYFAEWAGHGLGQLGCPSWRPWSGCANPGLGR